MTITFTTDAALKSAIARNFPNVAIRKCNEWNEWHIQPRGQSWADDSNRASIEAGHYKEEKASYRGDAYAEAALLHGVLSDQNKLARTVAQLNAEAESAAAGRADIA